MLEGLDLATTSLRKGMLILPLAFLLFSGPLALGQETPPSSPIPPLSQWRCKEGRLQEGRWVIPEGKGKVLVQSTDLCLRAGWRDLLCLRVKLDEEGVLRGKVKWRKKTSLEMREDLFCPFRRTAGSGEQEILIDLGRCWYWKGEIRGISIFLESPPRFSLEEIRLSPKSLFSLIQVKKEELSGGERGILYRYYFVAFLFVLFLSGAAGMVRIRGSFNSVVLLRASLGLVIFSSVLLQMSLGFTGVKENLSKAGKEVLQDPGKSVGAGRIVLLDDPRDPRLCDFMEFCRTLLPEGEVYGIFSPHRHFYFPLIRRIRYYFYPSLRVKTIYRMVPKFFQNVNIIYRMPVEEAARLVREGGLPFTVVAVFDPDKFILVRNSFLEEEMKTEPRWKKLREHFRHE